MKNDLLNIVRREVDHLSIRKVSLNCGSGPYSGVVTMRAMCHASSSPVSYAVSGKMFSTTVEDDTSYLISLNLYDSRGVPHPSNGISMVEYVPPGNTDFIMEPDEIHKHMDGLDPSLINVFSDSLLI